MTGIEKFADLMKQAKDIVFFGGAGVSTESRIPDFRGSHGLYKEKSKYAWSPEEMLSHHFYEEHPYEFFENYNDMARNIETAKPNKAHIALAALEKMGKLSGIITQNIDGLHQKAGSHRVWELHGSSWHNCCESCGADYSLPEYLKLAHPIPRCPRCGGVIKPGIVLYEEGLNETVLRGAVELLEKADLLIVAGTSLVVYPAAGLIDFFKGPIVLLNQDPTPYDDRCQLVFRENLGTVLEEAYKLLTK
jgi:NAD-dependent deacetylase